MVASNKDGGAHVDKKLSKEYGETAKSGFLGTITVGDTTIPIDNTHLTALRQIGYELLNSPEITTLVNVEIV